MSSPRPSSCDWRATLRRRASVVATALALWVAGIEAKLVYLQIYERTDLLALAERQQERTQPSPAKRGDILDRRGHVLATSVDADTILVHTDARRHAFARAERPPTSGSTIELTIDEYLQHIAERELHRGVVENVALGGSAIVMNPRTGEILA